MIALESVSKRFGSKTIVHDLTFTVGKGEIVGFLGPNGAGKTTTMRMIAGFTTASSGRITVAGCDMATQNEQAARKIGYLPEVPPLYDTLDVTQYLRFVARAKGVPRSEMKSEFDRVAAACRLEAVLGREVYKLSKGYRQRLGLAQALLGKPEVLLLDEPTASLDPDIGDRMRTYLERYQHRTGCTMLLASHHMGEVERMCDDVIMLRAGEVVDQGSPRALIERYGRGTMEEVFLDVARGRADDRLAGTAAEESHA
jgi:ABC-2 type transport system ATP-binding protein